MQGASSSVPLELTVNFDPPSDPCSTTSFVPADTAPSSTVNLLISSTTLLYIDMDHTESQSAGDYSICGGKQVSYVEDVSNAEVAYLSVSDSA